ncbi:MAG: OmpH family outer membrane protein [Flammeovirgaceae bacterium]|nr:OmpH family outer membrane protein [Flammeovirgaceae bacterium]
MKAIILTCSLFFLFQIGNAQRFTKIAYINQDSVVKALPEFKIQSRLFEAYTKQIVDQIEKMQSDIQQKMIELENLKNRNTLNEILMERQREIQVMANNLDRFKNESNANISRKEQELIQPISMKIQEGINEVAKQNGYQYVLPANILLYSDSANDITNQVIEEILQKN